MLLRRNSVGSCLVSGFDGTEIYSTNWDTDMHKSIGVARVGGEL